MLKEHDMAPDFTLEDQHGVPQTLSQFRGQYVLVYFYPKDDTPGCTKEACVIRDAYHAFELQNVKVFGISADSVKSHEKFALKYELPFTLLADTKKVVIELYGAKKPIGTKRISFLIDPDGTIAKIYPTVDPTTHGTQILKDVTDMRQ